ncbi:MAG: NfeD family protein [Alistipes indistinctus]
MLSGSILPAAASQVFPATLSSLHKEPAGQDGDDTEIDAVAGASGEKFTVPGSGGAAQSGTPGAQNAAVGKSPAARERPTERHGRRSRLERFSDALPDDRPATDFPDRTAAGTQEKPTVVYTFPIDGDIMPAQQRLAAKCLADARSGGAELVLIRLNTYGGLVNAADSIRTMILNSPVPVWVFVDNQAASAGALIAIAAERIYMRPGGSIGAASVVDQNGKPMPDKFQSFMRATMRATAEAHGKVIERIDGDDTSGAGGADPQVAEAMVGRTVGDSTTAGVLAFTASEALEHHYSEGTASTVDEVLAQGGVQQYTLHEYTPRGSTACWAG